jgi:pilus assembly protein Flp/PilA
MIGTEQTGLTVVLPKLKGNIIMGCKEVLRSFLRDDSGQDLIEYALIATLIAVGAIASLTTVATNIAAVFTKVAANLK